MTRSDVNQYWLLAAGGWAVNDAVGTGGRDPYGNPYGGDGATGRQTTVYGVNAAQGGCGGGAAYSYKGTAISGSGGVGFVYLYTQGVIGT